MQRLVFGIVFFLFPIVSQAAVSISEVAWIGSVESPNHEWIELHNDGAVTDVTGWHLTDGDSLVIELIGSIPANSYVVLERTSDESAAGTAFLIYTGALVNTGAALSLTRTDGTLVDQVSGGENWQTIGGDNVTKNTAQYTTGGWVTAPPTPGRGITATEVEHAQAEVVTKSTAHTKGGPLAKSVAVPPTVLTLPGVTLQLAVEAPAAGYVNQTVSLTAAASGIGNHLIDSLSYEWNFGDGTTAKGKVVEHVFQYPGTYVVVAYAGFKRQEQVARHTITVLPVALSLTLNSGGDVQINNDSPYELDLSGYRVVGEETVVFPSRTILLPNQTITVPKQKLGNTSMLLAVYDATGEAVTLRSPERFRTVAADTVAMIDSVSDFKQRNDQGVVRDQSEVPTLVLGGELTNATTSGLENKVTGAAPQSGSKHWPYYAFGALLAISTLGVFVAPRPSKDS